ncbi:MAG: nucleotidyl transferase AbiEii/AbiGii toxin family protein [Treponema sp.]|nr:nucleotidyl transferase AbiEii/AbiGii toxin family protein [Treponema sp.]
MKQTTPKAMSLRARINNYAKTHGITAQAVLQNYMFECFLDRLSKTKYSKNFIIKGGILVSSIVGLDIRSTMDMDATLKNLELTEEKIRSAATEIIAVNSEDGISYKIISLAPIRKDDVYGGFCLKLEAKYESIITPLSIDISTGDAITPEPLLYSYKRLFNDESITIRSYPIETILAEKLETIISRGVLNTRPRDFYDIYILTKTVSFNAKTLSNALAATSEHRGTSDLLKNETESRIAAIESSDALNDLWKKYQKKFPYAKDIAFEDTVKAAKKLLGI